MNRFYLTVFGMGDDEVPYYQTIALSDMVLDSAPPLVFAYLGVIAGLMQQEMRDFDVPTSRLEWHVVERFHLDDAA